MTDHNPSSERRSGVTTATVGVVGCVACCAGPILGWLAAIGIGTAGGVALFGVGGLAIASFAMIIVVRRRRRMAACSAVTRRTQPVAVGSPRLKTSR